MRGLPLTLIVVAAACGDDGFSTVADAAMAVDAAPPDPVTLTMLNTSGGGRAGVRVHFQATDSTLIASVDTDANGVASAAMPDGGYVTAVTHAASGSDELLTYAGVKPGDELRMTQQRFSPDHDVTFTLPQDVSAGVTQFAVSTPCDYQVEPTAGSPSTLVTLTMDTNCSPTSDVLITSLDANDEIVNWLYVHDANTSGATLDLSGMLLTTPPVSKTFTFNNAPATGVQFVETLSSLQGPLSSMTRGGPGTTVTSTLKLPPFGAAVESMLAVSAAPHGNHYMLDWGPVSPTTTSANIGVDARRLHEATSTGSYDVANRRVVWAEATTGSTPVFAIASAETNRTNLVFVWRVAAAYTTGGVVQYPTLPVENVDYNFSATDTVMVPRITTVQMSGGWDAARQHAFALRGFAWLMTPNSSGSIDYQEIE